MSEDKGWGWPLLAKKAHYFVKGRALCNKWLYLGSVEDDNHDSPDNCRVCQKLLVKKQKEWGEYNG